MKLFRWMLLGSLVALAACGPSEQKKADMAEKKRIECLDKFCKGDVEPKRDLLAEVALKFHGQWYLAPSYYFSTGMNGAAFYWPSKKNRDDVPQEERVEPYAHTVEIFLTGRQRWPILTAGKPWEWSRGEPPYWRELLSKGFTKKNISLSPDLMRVEFLDGNQKRDGTVYLVAVNEKRIRGEGAPILSCRISEPTSADDRCFGAEYWQEDVLADFRFSAKHAADWPAIHQEIVRVLNLAEKVQP